MKTLPRLFGVMVVLALATTSVFAQGRGFGPTMAPSKLRSVPAETTAAKAKGRVSSVGFATVPYWSLLTYYNGNMLFPS